jgi:5-deoxy-glucuronate isomerase
VQLFELQASDQLPRVASGRAAERVSQEKAIMNLLVGPEVFQDRIADFGFEHLSFAVRKQARGERYSAELGGVELAIVVLGGICSVKSSQGEWQRVGGRETVFDGLPYTLYLPPGTAFTVTAETDCDLAFCYCRAEEQHPAKLITPDEVGIEIRGGGNATRQINSMLPPDFPAQRLIVVEVFTPSGNWSSFPPHKHDVHNPPGEVDLDEIYYYRIDKPEGFAIQKVYTADRRLDETLTVRSGDLVLVPEGYHPVVAAHGYNVYYLNALSGSARSLAATDDPNYGWVRNEWREKDPRLPMVTSLPTVKR